MSGRNVPGRRFAGGTIRTKPFLVQKANQRQKDHKKKYLRPQQNHGIKKMLKKLRCYLFLFLLEQVAGAFRTVQTVDSACQSRSRPSGVYPTETDPQLYIYGAPYSLHNIICCRTCQYLRMTLPCGVSRRSGRKGCVSCVIRTGAVHRRRDVPAHAAGQHVRDRRG